MGWHWWSVVSMANTCTFHFSLVIIHRFFQAFNANKDFVMGGRVQWVRNCLFTRIMFIIIKRDVDVLKAKELCCSFGVGSLCNINRRRSLGGWHFECHLCNFDARCIIGGLPRASKRLQDFWQALRKQHESAWSHLTNDHPSSWMS